MIDDLRWKSICINRLIGLGAINLPWDWILEHDPDIVIAHISARLYRSKLIEKCHSMYVDREKNKAYYVFDCVLETP